MKAVLNAVGGAAATAAVYGGAPDTAALAASIGLVRDIPGGGVRFLAMPLPGADGQWTWPRREDARDAAQMVAEAYGQPTLPYRVEACRLTRRWTCTAWSPCRNRTFCCTVPLPGSFCTKPKSANRRFCGAAPAWLEPRRAPYTRTLIRRSGASLREEYPCRLLMS